MQKPAVSAFREAHLRVGKPAPALPQATRWKALKRGRGCPLWRWGVRLTGGVESSGGRCLWWEVAEQEMLRLAPHVELEGSRSF